MDILIINWNEHVTKILNKARQKLWFIRRLKKAGASKKKRWWKCLIYLFGSHFEFAAQLWAGALTMANKQKLKESKPMQQI